MYYNMQLIYENIKYYHTESFVETDTIYESPFNSYIMCHPTGDKELDESMRSSISEVLTPDRRDDINGYVMDIKLVNNKISVDIINQQNLCESLIKLPVEQVKVLGKMIFNKMQKIQIKNKWLAHQDFMNNFYASVDKGIHYEETTAKSSISLKYISYSKKRTNIEKKIIEAFNMFMALHLTGDGGRHCTSIELQRKSTHPIITGIIHDNLGYYKRIVINLKNVRKSKVTYILDNLNKNYDFVYEQAEEYYKQEKGKNNGEQSIKSRPLC